MLHSRRSTLLEIKIDQFNWRQQMSLTRRRKVDGFGLARGGQTAIPEVEAQQALVAVLFGASSI
jgi:hypothetical protein